MLELVHCEGRSKIEAVRAYFDGRVSRQEDREVKHKVGSAYVIQTSERTEDATEKIEWTTIIEVANVLFDDATITQAETAAAVEAAKADQIIFDLDGNLIEEWDKNTKE